MNIVMDRSIVDEKYRRNQGVHKYNCLNIEGFVRRFGTLGLLGSDYEFLASGARKKARELNSHAFMLSAKKEIKYISGCG